MFGGEKEQTLSEKSVLNPKSPYAAAKVFAMTSQRYIESYDIFV